MASLTATDILRASRLIDKLRQIREMDEFVEKYPSKLEMGPFVSHQMWDYTTMGLQSDAEYRVWFAACIRARLGGLANQIQDELKTLGVDPDT